MKQMSPAMSTSPKPHIIPAFYRWLSENDPKVFMNVVLNVPGVDISPYPPEKVLENIKIANSEGKQYDITMIRLNTDPVAVNNFVMIESGISFQCRLIGKVTSVFIPYDAITDLYCPASEIVQAFGLDLGLLNQEPVQSKVVSQEKQEQPKRAHLSLVK